MKILESYTRLAKSLFVEEDVKDKKIKFKDKDGNDKEATVGGILKKGEDHPAYGDAKAMVDKGKDGEEEEPSGKLGAGDFERDSDDSEPAGGGDFTKSADYDMWSDDDELAISGTDSDDPAGGKGDAWMTGDDAKQKGMDRASGLANKGMEKRPGGEQAEKDYQKADQMIKKLQLVVF